MSPITHALTGWSVACVAPINRRERGFVTLAGVIPDFDGLGIVADLLSKPLRISTDFWGTYHHVLGHNLGCALAFSVAAFMFSTHRWLTSGLVFLSFHLHLFGDVLGGRGPDGDQWPIPYLLPFSDSIRWLWSGQWHLNGWQNFVITGALLAFTIYNAWRIGASPLDFISRKANREFVKALRNRFGEPSR